MREHCLSKHGYDGMGMMGPSVSIARHAYAMLHAALSFFPSMPSLLKPCSLFVLLHPCVQLSAGLSEMALNEKSAMNNMFDRETQREKNLEKAMKEARMKAKKDAVKKDEVGHGQN